MRRATLFLFVLAFVLAGCKSAQPSLGATWDSGPKVTAGEYDFYAPPGASFPPPAPQPVAAPVQASAFGVGPVLAFLVFAAAVGALYYFVLKPRLDAKRKAKEAAPKS